MKRCPLSFSAGSPPVAGVPPRRAHGTLHGVKVSEWVIYLAQVYDGAAAITNIFIGGNIMLDLLAVFNYN